MRCLQKDRRGKTTGSFRQDREGSLTVEALLILPVVFLLMVILIRWCLVLHQDIETAAERRREILRQEIAPAGGDTSGEKAPEAWFLYGGPPARRIRDADVLIELGYAIKEKLPVWFQTDEK